MKNTKVTSAASKVRHERERVWRVMTFTGQALRVPDGAISLLTLAPTAREYPYRRSREDEGRSAAGLSQAAALQHDRDNTDNEQFLLNVVHWLSGLLN